MFEHTSTLTHNEKIMDISVTNFEDEQTTHNELLVPKTLEIEIYRDNEHKNLLFWVSFISDYITIFKFVFHV